MNVSHPPSYLPGQVSPVRSTELVDELASIYEKACRSEAESSKYNGSLKWQSFPVVLFGAGPLAQMTLTHLRRIGIEPICLADNNSKRWGAAFDGLTILSPSDALLRYGAEARFVVTIYNGKAVREQLAQLGCAHVVHFADLYFDNAREFLPYCGLATRAAVLESWQEVAAATQVWHDDRSVGEYLAQLAWRLRVPGRQLSQPDSPSECYFPTGLFKLLKDEVLFDCGAFDGDSMRQYLDRRPPDSTSRILAFEPDPGSFSRLTEFVGQLPNSLASQIRIEPWAVAEKSGTVHFSALGSVRSGVAESGGSSVTAIAIDDLDVAPTLIKMDVEGFEMSALSGGQAVLKRHLPVLAISLYHHASDLWKIPNFLNKLVPDYRLYLRRYAEDCWELVLYAVPVSRMVNPSAARIGD